MTLTGRSLGYYWRWQVGVALGVMVAAGVIAGSLVTGDSVRATLAAQAAERLGKVGTAVVAADGFFTERLAAEVPGGVPVLLVEGTVSVPGDGRRVNGVNIYGVRGDFWGLGRHGGMEGQGLLVNAALGRALGLAIGGRPEVVVRFEKPSLISRDAPLSGESDLTVTLREAVAGVAEAEGMGAFSLKAGQEPALNVFLPLAQLQAAAGLAGRANLLLSEGEVGAVSPAVEAALRLEDAGLGWKAAGGERILSSGRIFLSPDAAGAAQTAFPEGKGVLTYLVNRIENGSGSVTPYSMATAAEPGTGGLPMDWPEQTVLVTQWLADDLQVKAGDSITMKYFRVTRARQLEEAEVNLVIHAVLPMDHPAVRREWMPDFPGVTESENCRDWKPGIPVDQSLIRDKDDAYWKERKGTPKVFLRLGEGQKFWGNRFGNLTAVWVKSEVPVEALDKALGERFTAAQAGLVTVGVREAARKAVAEGMDFGVLFVSMSGFLIGTALLLAVLLFLLGTGQRAGQVGLLRACGWTPGQVRNLFLKEALWVAVPAAAVGTALGLLYTKWTLGKLEREWAEAALGLKFLLTVRPGTLFTAWLVTLLLSVGSVGWTVRRIGQARAGRLLSGATVAEALAPPGQGAAGNRRWRWLPVGGLALMGGAMLFLSGRVEQQFQPMMFFGAGALLLADGLRALNGYLGRMARETEEERVPGIWEVGRRNAARQRGRSMALAALLAAGIFMVVALNAFRQDARLMPGDRQSGTGGFALAGSSTLPVYEDLNTGTGREVWGLEDDETHGVTVIPFRVRQGEEASCLNLNRAQTPRVLGVEARLLAERNAFPVAGLAKGVPLAEGASPWTLLNLKPTDGTVPAIMDQYSAMFALGKKAGDEVVVPDGQGRPVRLRLVALLAGTVLQGNVVIGEAAFVKLYPDTGGYQYFLVEAEPEAAARWGPAAMRQLAGRGLAVQPVAEKLAQFQAVQNTYLTIFSTLGGLALVLSTLGLGVLVARQVLERRGEFALLQAVGFQRRQLQWMVLAEHWFLFLAAVGLGTGTALIAVQPNLKLAGAGGLPLGLLAGLLLSVTAGGLIFCHLAARLALGRSLIGALRQE